VHYLLLLCLYLLCFLQQTQPSTGNATHAAQLQLQMSARCWQKSCRGAG
jgi:hypothetical protein